MIMPFLPLFLMDMGVPHGKEVSMWTGMIFSATFLSAAVMALFGERLRTGMGRKRTSCGLGSGWGSSIS